MKLYLAPGLLFLACTLASVALAAMVILATMFQPWLGLSLTVVDSRNAVTLTRAYDTGSAAVVGLDLISVQAIGQDPIPVTAVTLIEEPDMMPTVEGLRRFYAHQDAIFQALQTGQVTLTFQDADSDRAAPIRLTVEVQQTRPIAALPTKFWTQLGVGLVGLVIGVWLVSVRSRDLAAWMVLLTGVGLAMSAWAAGIYSSREIALSLASFRTASQINSTGTLTFGIGILTLFLIYPRRILPKPLLFVPTIAIGSVIAFIQLYDWPRHVGLLQDSVATIMAALLLAIGVQVYVNRHEPAALAMLGWLGLAVTVGAGSFVAAVILPTLLAQEILVAQSTAFLFFLIIYVGIALGVSRYRLFDLPIWSFRVLFYGFGVVLLLLLDAVLIFGLSVDRAPALGLSLAVIGGIYLPLRERIGAWLGSGRTMPPEELYRRITEISHTLDPRQKQAAQLAFWQDIYDPLSADILDPGTSVRTGIDQNGAALALAPVFGLPALRLSWAKKGTRLFSSQDLERARTLHAFMDTSLRQNQIYLDAIDTERSRINRDMHDNIGVLLISALHSDDSERKNDLIRQTLFDLREIVSNPDSNAYPLDHLVADLRAQASGYLDVAGIEAEWQSGTLPQIDLNTAAVQTMRAVILEGTNNAIQHSGAKKVKFSIAVDAQDLRLTLADNGTGVRAGAATRGNGLKNLSDRVSQLSGTFDLTSAATGTVLSARIPVIQTVAGVVR